MKFSLFMIYVIYEEKTEKSKMESYSHMCYTTLKIDSSICRVCSETRIYDVITPRETLLDTARKFSFCTRKLLRIPSVNILNWGSESPFLWSLYVSSLFYLISFVVEDLQNHLRNTEFLYNGFNQNCEGI